MFYQANFQILASVLTAIETEPQKYQNTRLARSGVNQMWILKRTLKT